MTEKFAHVLVNKGLISEAVLDAAIDEARSRKVNIVSLLIEKTLIAKDQIAKLYEETYRIPVADLESFQVDQSLIDLIPENVVTQYQVIPIAREGNQLTLAMLDPNDMAVLNVVQFVTRCHIKPVVAFEEDIKSCIIKYYSAEDVTESIMSNLENLEFEAIQAGDDEDDVSMEDLKNATEDAPVVRLVNGLLIDAVNRGVSDIHIEPYERSMRVRYRLDGTLMEMTPLPLKIKPVVTSRVKIMADLNIAERRVPQDGRIKIRVGKKEVDLRVSTLPVIFGEKIVLRLLDPSGLMLDLAKLGFEEREYKVIMDEVHKPYGMCLVTGPTGSGKSTTLYSVLSNINVVSTNIMTCEDPVEYNLHGINQVAINEKVGLTFPTALRSFLRQDPNIIMVGEIRDKETADIAVRAAITGHLVLSTLHTNNAPETISRLMDMGIEPFMLTSALNMVIAQRLVRKICQKCKQPDTVSPELIERAGFKLSDFDGSSMWKGKGCSACNNGYKGRTGLYELMQLTPQIKDMINIGKSIMDIQKVAEEQGMITLRQQAIRKVKAGITSFEEVLRETM